VSSGTIDSLLSEMETQVPRSEMMRALDQELAEQQAHMNAAMARWLSLLARFDDVSNGDPVERWAALRFGVSPGEARELTRVARALRGLPAIQTAFARGELTYTKVRSLTRVATPACEQRLVELAGALTAAQLERALRVYRRVSAAQAGRSHELEYVSYYWDDDGSLVLRARLAAEDGTILVRALQAARDRVQERRRKARREQHETVAARSFSPPRDADVEALLDLLDAARDRTPEKKRRDVRAPAPPRLVVHVDAATLTRDVAGRCELEHGPVISADTARRLGCDASTLVVTEDGGQPATVGRTRRTVPTWLRRQLESRDSGACQWPGCNNHRYLHAHHKQHWSKGGETSLDNLILLCTHHHRLVHEGGYAIHCDPDDRPRFTNRHGVAVPSTPRPPPGRADAITVQNEQAGLIITSHTNNNGTGEPVRDLLGAVSAVVGD
jgi:Domain of unknown function (DUF222)/HNH endonuclease